MVRSLVRLTSSLALAGALCLSGTAFAQSVVTEPVGFQGVLKSASGVPVADTTTQSLTFRVYDFVSGPGKLWEETIPNVTVKGGLFSVNLDFSTGFLASATNASVFNGSPVYIEVQAGADPPMTPRRQFTATPYAFTAQTALSVPNGAITAGNLAAGVLPTTLPPSGSAGGDLSGSYPNPTLANLATSLSKASGGVMTSSAGKIGIGTTTPNAILDVNGTAAIRGANYLEFGAGVANKEPNAGKMGYELFTTGALDIVGAGQTAGARSIKFWNEGGASFIGPIITPGLRMTTSPGVGKVLTSDASGNASWQTAAAAGATGPAGGDLAGTYPNPTLASLASSLNKVSGGALTNSSGKIGIGNASPGFPLSFANGTGDKIGLSGASGAHFGLGVQASQLQIHTDVSTSDVVFGYGASAAFTESARVKGTGEIIAKVVTVTGGSDVAEPYEVASAGDVKPVPGMVVAIDSEHVGRLRVASRAYDTAVAGILSGANGIAPGITLRQKGTVADGSLPMASTGRVWCYCDADANGPIRAGDLLTTSDTPGHAMRASDRERRDGAVIGKAMSPLTSGRGLVLVLVSLK